MHLSFCSMNYCCNDMITIKNTCKFVYLNTHDFLATIYLVKKKSQKKKDSQSNIFDIDNNNYYNDLYKQYVPKMSNSQKLNYAQKDCSFVIGLKNAYDPQNIRQIRYYLGNADKMEFNEFNPLIENEKFALYQYDDETVKESNLMVGNDFKKLIFYNINLHDFVLCDCNELDVILINVFDCKFSLLIESKSELNLIIHNSINNDFEYDSNLLKINKLYITNKNFYDNQTFLQKYKCNYLKSITLDCSGQLDNALSLKTNWKSFPYLKYIKILINVHVLFTPRVQYLLDFIKGLSLYQLDCCCIDFSYVKEIKIKICVLKELIKTTMKKSKDALVLKLSNYLSITLISSVILQFEYNMKDITSILILDLSELTIEELEDSLFIICRLLNQFYNKIKICVKLAIDSPEPVQLLKKVQYVLQMPIIQCATQGYSYFINCNRYSIGKNNDNNNDSSYIFKQSISNIEFNIIHNFLYDNEFFSNINYF